MINKSLSVTIGIPAYNAEKNIKKLLESMINQEEDKFYISKIIVHSDCSSDKTVSESASVKNKKITVISSDKRLGFAGSFIKILKKSDSDITILLNDDIKVVRKNFISEILKTFNQSNKIGLVSGNIKPLKPDTFIEKSVISSINIYNQMRIKINEGNNHFACDGKILALSRSFIKSIQFPANLNKLGNVDAYLYFLCLKNGFEFRFAKNAQALYRCPSNISDYIKWTSRNNSNYNLLKKQFGVVVENDFKKPTRWFYYYSSKEIMHNPLGAIFIVLTGLYIKYKSKTHVQYNSYIWEVVSSTKNLN